MKMKDGKETVLHSYSLHHPGSGFRLDSSRVSDGLTSGWSLINCRLIFTTTLRLQYVGPLWAVPFITPFLTYHPLTTTPSGLKVRIRMVSQNYSRGV